MTACDGPRDASSLVVGSNNSMKRLRLEPDTILPVGRDLERTCGLVGGGQA